LHLSDGDGISLSAASQIENADILGVTMNYEAVTRLWKEQNTLFETWEKDLVKKADELRAHLERVLAPPAESWEDPEPGKKGRYIDIVDILEAQTQSAEGLSNKSLTDNYELIVGLSITLENGSDSHPKSIYKLPVALRYIDEELEYTIFDIEKEEFLEWENDIDHFTEAIFDQLENYFSFNPYVGPRDDLKIGFLKKQ
jgi:hypothetical protein